MVLKYFFARLRKNIWLTLLGSFAVFFVCTALIIASSMPQVLNDVLVGYSRQLCGDADIVITNSLESGERYFGLPALRSDAVLSENAEYINGYFMSVAEIEYGGVLEYCTFFAADYEQQNEYNPIIAKNLPTVLYDSDIIIGEKYAQKNGLGVGSHAKITMFGKSMSFDVVCIAESKGLFVTGNSVFVSSKALKDFLGFPASTIVNQCFIKAKSAESLEIIRAVLATDHTRFGVDMAIDANKIAQNVRNEMIPVVYVAILVTLFCALTLFMLLRLVFTRDRANFAQLRNMGMRERQITAIGLLTGLAMCVLAFAASLVLVFFAQSFVRNSAFLLSGTKIGVWSYVLGLGGSFGISMLCAVFGTRERKVKSAERPSRVLTFLHKKRQTLSSLELKTLASSRDWRRFALFAAVGTLTALMIGLSQISLHVSITASIANLSGAQGGSLNDYFAGLLSDFIWIFDVLCTCLLVLVATTIVFLSFLRQLAHAEEVRRLVPIGLSRGKQTKRSFTAAFFALLPAMIIIPFVFVLICSINAPISQMFYHMAMQNIVSSIVFINIACFLFVLFTETLVSRLVFQKNLVL